MNSIQLGDEVLSWTREVVTLTDSAGGFFTVTPGGGALRDAPMDQKGNQVVLASRSSAVFADGDADSMDFFDFVSEIESATLGNARVLLGGADRVTLVDFATASEVATETAGGQFRPNLVLVLPNDAFACGFHDRVAVFSADGTHNSFTVQVNFETLAHVGDFVLAAGRDFLLLVNFVTLGAPLETNSNGAINGALIRVSGDLGAVPSRDSVAIVDGRGGQINQRFVNGQILNVTIQNEMVIVDSAGNNRTFFDRDGNEVAVA